MSRDPRNFIRQHVIGRGSRVEYTAAHLQHMKWMIDQDAGNVVELLPMSDRLVARVLWDSTRTTSWVNVACLKNYNPENTK